MISKIPTRFASAERADPISLLGQNQYFSNFDLLCQILDSVPNGVIILNAERQIVFLNQTMLAFSGLATKEEALGMRIGEAIGCRHAFEDVGGCGTTDACRSCGAIHAILIAQKDIGNTRECRIARGEDEQFGALDLRVTATPLQVNGDQLTIFSMIDIADEKRRQVLERIFFHDLRNTATIIHGAVELLQYQAEEVPASRMLNQASRKLIDEIDTQQQLLAAENGRLELNLADMLTLPLLEELTGFYETQAANRHCQIVIDPAAENLLFLTDEAVVGRVLGNMIKNAIEACAEDQTVTVGCRKEGDTAVFWVHNPAYMPPHIQRQVFLRSFSTKGTQRGLGTYSMRLLSEGFLKGKVQFVTDQTAGTTFTAVYPIRLDLTPVRSEENSSSQTIALGFRLPLAPRPPAAADAGRRS